MSEGNAGEDDAAASGESDSSGPTDPTADAQPPETDDSGTDGTPSEPSEPSASTADTEGSESADAADDTQSPKSAIERVSTSSEATSGTQSDETAADSHSSEAQSSEAAADESATGSDETAEEPAPETDGTADESTPDPSEPIADTQIPDARESTSETHSSESPPSPAETYPPEASDTASGTSDSAPSDTASAEATSETPDPAPETQASGTPSAAPDAPAVGTPEPAGGGPAPSSPEPVGGDFAGAPDDQEMPLTEHIREMVRRLGVVIAVMAVISVIVFPFADRLINWLWYSFLPGPPSECVQVASAAAGGSGSVGSGTDAACPRLYHPLSLVLARLKVASLSGFIIALPVFVYETYLFMRPGLYPNERRYYLASVPTSLVLAGVGLAFAYFLVLPVIFIYFLGYSQPVATIAFSLSQTFDLILLMLGMFAFIFQIPLFMMLAIMMGVTSRRWLESRRLYFWMGFAGVAFIFSPDPTGMAPFIVAATMVLLFEGTLLLLRWTGR